MQHAQLPALALLLGCTSLASAQVGPDVVVLRVGETLGGGDSIAHYSSVPGEEAFAFAISSCNLGTLPVDWASATHDHPVNAQNLYRLRDGRFEQLGASFVKHGYCALNQAGCGTCQPTGCLTLGIGCADSSTASLSDGNLGGRRSEVDATSGVHTTITGPTGGTNAGRLIVQSNELDPAVAGNALASYFIEAQYIAADDHAAGNAANNASWRAVDVTPWLGLSGATPTVIDPAIFAWQSRDAGVQIDELTNLDEGGPGVHGSYFVGHRATDNGDGTWTYSYAVQNLNSSQAAGAFRVPASASANLTGVWFTDVEPHSGEPYDNTDWTFSLVGGAAEWRSTTTAAVDPNGNALRWGTLYAFGFTADAAPVVGSCGLDMYHPGVGSTLTAPVAGPGLGTGLGTPFCLGDGSAGACPCGNQSSVGADEGCVSSMGRGALLTAHGSVSVAADDLVFALHGARPSQPSVLLQGAVPIQLPFRDGILCLGSPTERLEVVFLDAAGSGLSSTSIVSEGQIPGPGTQRVYQQWFRDPGGSPCGTGSNLSQGVQITFQ